MLKKGQKSAFEHFQNGTSKSAVNKESDQN
jgi:hypothetical protein